eukprot:m.13884 g.13884  ORF g.13884 m.13884 type:complete len:552 (+) comp4213_c0_seq1:29-1684(+)
MMPVIRLVYGNELITLVERTTSEKPQGAGMRSVQYDCRLPLPLPDSAAIVFVASREETPISISQAAATQPNDDLLVSGSMGLMIEPDIPLVDCGYISQSSIFATVCDFRAVKKMHRNKLLDLEDVGVNCKFLFDASLEYKVPSTPLSSTQNTPTTPVAAMNESFSDCNTSSPMGLHSSSEDLESQLVPITTPRSKRGKRQEETPSGKRKPLNSSEKRKKPKAVKKSIFNNSAILEPSPRWGHTLCSDGEDAVFLFGGQGHNQLSTDSFWKFDTEKNLWDEIEAEGKLPGTRMGHSCVYDKENMCLYVFGGAKKKRFFRDVHKFDISTKTWSSVEVKGGKAPALSYHSCVLFHNMLMVFGGNFPMPDPIPDGCSDALHCFNIEKQLWYKPILVGDLPTARSGHSCTTVDDSLYLIGGWDAPVCFNDVYQLDVCLMESTKLQPKGQAPPPRTWHVAFHVTYRSHDGIFIHGGFDGEKALDDAYVLDLVTLEWIKISDAYTTHPCAGHDAARVGDEVIVFGGGDNDDRFYNTLTKWHATEDMNDSINDNSLDNE